ncbi:coat protein [Tanacetum coccineum]
MENLEEQVETLTKLMASLDIPSEANDEDADIIFDYSSDENPYENPYTEYNFAQKRKKSYVDEDLQREFDYKPPTQTERYLYQQGKIRTKKNKWEQIPPQYIPKIPITRMDYDILNLDCETDIDEIIQDWNNRLSAQIQLTEELRVLNPRDLLNFIIHRTSGNVYRFIESLDELELSRIATTDAMTTFKNVVARIVQEFTGRIPGVEASNKAFREHAYWRLINLKICNMCYLDPFICEFSDQYYKLDPTRQKTALEMFFNKLPESVSTKIKDMYNGILQDGTRIQDTLGARITTLKAWMRQECLQETAKKEAQVKLCCEMQSDKVGHYANTCPKRGEKKETEVLKIAYDLGYEPLEDSDIDSDIEIYAYTNSSDYSSDTSSNHE